MSENTQAHARPPGTAKTLLYGQPLTAKLPVPHTPAGPALASHFLRAREVGRERGPRVPLRAAMPGDAAGEQSGNGQAPPQQGPGATVCRGALRRLPMWQFYRAAGRAPPGGPPLTGELPGTFETDTGVIYSRPAPVPRLRAPTAIGTDTDVIFQN